MRAHSANSFRKSVFGLSTLLISSSVFAAGFEIQEQNAVHLGTAYAGTAAWGVDASSNYYNAAALTRIDRNQLVASGVLIAGSFDFNASRTNMPAAAATPLPGAMDDDPGGLAAVPSLHYAARLTKDLVFGLSVTAPFGLKTNYDEAGPLRYVATKSELRTYDITPSIAWKATDWLSIAAGPDFLYADTVLDVKTNFGGITPSVDDGFQKNRAVDWAFGWHAGVLVDITEGARIGAHYRSSFSLGAEGDSRNFSAPSAALVNGGGGLYSTRKVQASVTLPETAKLSGYYDILPCVGLMMDVAWTRWSRFDNLTLTLNPPPLPVGADTNTVENFKNVWRVAFGANYVHNNQWQFRGGFAWDQSPVQDSHRTARIPDSDRIWLGLGVGYALNDALHVDVGYAHLFFDESRLSDRGPNAVATGRPVLPFNIVEGEYSGNANILGVQVRYDFV